MTAEATRREFPTLSDTMQGAGHLARSSGLELRQFNAGAANSENGFRIFERGACGHDFFDPGYLIHLKTKAEVLAWLHGYGIRTGARR